MNIRTHYHLHMSMSCDYYIQPTHLMRPTAFLLVYFMYVNKLDFTNLASCITYHHKLHVTTKLFK